jgi:nitrogen PTS system EIIA component
MKMLHDRSFFDPGSVVWSIRSTEKFAALREVIERSGIFSQIPGLDIEEFITSVIDREKLQSTGFGHGVAVAHGRTRQVQDPHVVLGVSREGIEYDAIDGEPVQLLFVIANHPDNKMDYLQVLSCLVSLVRDQIFRNELLSCMSQQELERKMCSSFKSMMARNAQLV